MRVFGKTLLEFPISYSHTERYLIFSLYEAINNWKQSTIKQILVTDTPPLPTPPAPTPIAEPGASVTRDIRCAHENPLSRKILNIHPGLPANVGKTRWGLNIQRITSVWNWYAIRCSTWILKKSSSVPNELVLLRFYPQLMVTYQKLLINIPKLSTDENVQIYG